MRQARQLDPYSPVSSAALARILYYQRNYAEAERIYKEALELEPDFVPALLGLGLTYLSQHRVAEAATAFRNALPDRANRLVQTFEAVTQTPNGEALLNNVKCDPSEEAYCSFSVAVLASLAGFPDQAFQWLDRAYEARSEYLVYLKADPIFDRIREYPRYDELLEKIGLD